MFNLQPALIHPPFLATPYVRPTIKVVADDTIAPRSKEAAVHCLVGMVMAMLSKDKLPKWEVYSRMCSLDGHGYVWLERYFDEAADATIADLEGMKILRTVCEIYKDLANERKSLLPRIETNNGQSQRG